jgi:LemA protein
MSVVVTLVVVLLAIFWAIGIYNRLIGLRKQVLSGWRQIDVQLKRRHDLVRDVVETVGAAVDGEREALDAVSAANVRASAASGPADAAQKEGELTEALTRLFALANSHPQLAVNADVRALWQELSATEDKIAFARQSYNDVATKYNAAIQVVPNNVIAGFGGFKQAALFVSPQSTVVVSPQSTVHSPQSRNSAD